MDTNGWIIWGLQLLVTTALGVMGLLLKHSISRALKDIERQGMRITEVECKLNKTISDMPLMYTLREDFLRATSNQDKKLDAILDKIADIKSRQ